MARDAPARAAVLPSRAALASRWKPVLARSASTCEKPDSISRGAHAIPAPTSPVSFVMASGPVELLCVLW